jgi:nucleotide-binding universal stress UspA family protein
MLAAVYASTIVKIILFQGGVMFKHIMVTLDGSKIAEESIPVAIGMSKKMEAKVVLLQVVEVFSLLKADKEAEEKALKNTAQEYLNSIKSKIEKEGIQTDIAILTGKSSVEICNYAKQSGVDLIIMTAHGRSGLTGWAVGSVSEKVVRHACKPVLLLRSTLKEE